MAEKGIDLSHHTSDRIDKYVGMQCDYVITVCDNANQSCPYFPTNRTKWHWNFEDSSAATGTEEERLAKFREVRGLIEKRLAVLP
jgi:arsenate reductase